MQHTLESQKAFPYIAWMVVISFAFFVYNMTTNISVEISLLEERRLETLARIDNLD